MIPTVICHIIICLNVTATLMTASQITHVNSDI